MCALDLDLVATHSGHYALTAGLPVDEADGAAQREQQLLELNRQSRQDDLQVRVIVSRTAVYLCCSSVSATLQLTAHATDNWLQ